MKPCVHGSDAHETKKVFKPDQERFCWIKADTTFEGLKQILYEPEDRVYIGPTAPGLHDNSRVISEVRIKDPSGCFGTIAIPLNRGLVSIIGQKGSGKSALAELIAIAAGSWEYDDGNTFLERAGDELHGVEIELEWLDGEITPHQIGTESSDAQSVRYLSQDFVERLCANDGVGSELVKEIEAVIFSFQDATEKLFASNFEELRAARTEGIREEAQRVREELQRLIAEGGVLQTAAMKLDEKKERIQTLQKEKDSLQKQLPKASTEDAKKTEAELAAARTELSKLQTAVATRKQKIQKARDVTNQVSAFKAQVKKFNTQIDTMLVDIGLNEAERKHFELQFRGDVDAPITSRIQAIEKEVKACEGTADAPAEGTIRYVEKKIEELLSKESADKSLQAKIRKIHARISEIDLEIASITAEIKKIEGPDAARRKTINEERSRNYSLYFENLKKEQETLEELYGPVEARLSGHEAAQEEQELEFSIRWEANVDQWLDRGSSLFDQRKANPYGSMDALSDAARKILEPAWAAGDPAKIAIAHEQFLDAFRNANLPPAKYLRSGISREDLLEWLYKVDHIQLSYGLKYNGTELEKLSPGTKGIVLLILYLGVDVRDSRPLIVDQPDENLDNESIFELLTAYFKKSKRRRQIILITHNPNLVVNSDAEQMVVASAERQTEGLPHITYESGAIEHNDGESGIRGKVCRILEGGAAAFQKREQRYALPKGAE